MPDFTALVATGKYDRWAKVAADRKKYGADKCVTFSTEAGRFNTATLATTFGPTARRGGTGGTEVVVTLPPGFTQVGDAYNHQLSDKTYNHNAAHGGKPYPPFAVCVVPARHDETGALVDFVGGHLALPNTPRRVEVSNDCLFGETGLVWLVKTITLGQHVVVGLDTNLAWKNPDDRALLQRVARETGCHWAYETKVPTTKRSLIDNLLTDLPVRTVELIDPVASSDHPWTRVGLTIPAPVTPTPAPVPVPSPRPVPTPTPEAPVTDDRYDRVTFRGRTVDKWTRAALEQCERDLGYELTISQGSYNAGRVSASAGTHDGGGVIDLAPWDADRKVAVLRKNGFAAWHRVPSQGPWKEHVHAVLIGNEKAAGSAQRQVAAYLAGRNGLANNARDGGPRARIVFPYPPPDPFPIPAPEAGMNHVQYGHKLIAAGLAEWAKAKGRPAVAAAAALVRAGKATAPKG